MVGPKREMTLLTPTDSVMNTGDTSKAWTVVRKLIGTMGTLNIKEDRLYNKDTVTAEYKYRIDYLSGTNPAKGDQLRWGTRIFDINAVDNPGFQDRVLTLYILERT